MASGRSRALDLTLRLKDEASKKLQGFQKNLDGTSQKTGGLRSAMGLLGPAVVATLAGFAASKVVAVGKELIVTAAVAEQTAKTFRALGGSGEGLEALRQATRGFVDDAALIASTNKMLSMELASNAIEAAELAEMATQLGSAMGKGATPAMEEFAIMLANQSIPRLDTFGISAGWVRTRINELMKETEGLTREQAFMTATLEAGRVAMQRVGEQSGGAAGIMARWQATIKNIKTEIGTAFLPVLEEVGPVVQEVADAIANFVRSEEFQGAIKTLIDELHGLRQSIKDIDPEIKEAVKNLLSFAQALGKAVKPLIVFTEAAKQQRLSQFSQDVNEVADGIQWFTERVNDSVTALPSFWEKIDAVEVKLRTLVSTLPGGQEALSALGLSTQSTASSMSNMAGIAGLTEDALHSETIAMREAGIAAQEVATQVVSVDITQEAFATAVETRKAALQSLIVATQEHQANMATIVAGHEQNLVQIRQQGADTTLDMQFNYNLQRAQSEQAYQAQHHALLVAGKQGEANELEASHAREQSLAKHDYSIKQQLQQRSLLVQKITAQRAYVAQLKEQYEKAKQALDLARLEAEGKVKSELEGQVAIVKIDIIEGRRQLETQRLIAEDKVGIYAKANRTVIKGAITTAQALLAAQKLELTAAEGHLKELEEQLSSFKIDLPPIPMPDMSALDGIGPGIDAATTRATRAVTQTIAETAEDIAKGIEFVKSALEDLVDFVLPTGYERGLERLNTFFVTAFEKLSDAIDGADEETKVFGETIEAMSGGLASAMKLFEGLAGYVDPAEENVYQFQHRVASMMGGWGRWITSPELNAGYDSELVGALGSSMQGLMGGLRNALGVTKELSEYVDVPEAAFAAFQGDIATMLTGWNDWIAGPALEIDIAGITSYVKSLGPVMDAMNKIMDVFGKIQTMYDSAELFIGLQAFDAAFRSLMIYIGNMVTEFEGSALADAEKFENMALAMTGAVGAGGAALGLIPPIAGSPVISGGTTGGASQSTREWHLVLEIPGLGIAEGNVTENEKTGEVTSSNLRLNASSKGG